MFGTKFGGASGSSTGSTGRDAASNKMNNAEEVADIVKMVEKTAITDKLRTEDAYKVEASVEEFDLENKVPQAPKQYKIAMFAWESLHAVAVGGVAPHLTNLAAGMERRGHEVHVFVRSGGGQKHYELIDGVHVHRITFGLDNDFVNEIGNMCNAMVHAFFECEGFMNAKFDICHAHDWLAAPALIQIKNQQWDRKCVFTIHSTEYGRCGNNSYGGQSARIRGIEQEAINKADRVIAVSGVLCDEVKGHYDFNWSNLRRVYNGIECRPYDGELWDPGFIRSMYDIGPMDPMVLFVGRMATQKGPDILVEAIPMLLASRPDAKFVMVGDGYMKAGLVARCGEMGVSGSVRFVGAKSGQSLIDLFRATDIVCVPSRNEPFGIVVLEGWAAKKPVVATKNGGPREFVWHDNDGYVVDANPTGIAWGVGSIFANFDHGRWMGERGRVKAAFQFSWDRIAMETNDVYDELYGIFPPTEEEIKTAAAKAASEAAAGKAKPQDSATPKPFVNQAKIGA